MNIYQKTFFKKVYKKLHDNQVPEVNKAITAIIENPDIGEMKKGDLAGIQIHKFDVQNQLYLLAYIVESEDLMLLALGVHENFYDKHKR
jgi:hypothetical protein